MLVKQHRNRADVEAIQVDPSGAECNTVQYSAIQNALRFHKRKESLTEGGKEGRIDPESLRIRHNIYCAAYIVDACSPLLGGRGGQRTRQR